MNARILVALTPQKDILEAIEISNKHVLGAKISDAQRFIIIAALFKDLQTSKVLAFAEMVKMIRDILDMEVLKLEPIKEDKTDENNSN